MRIVAVVRDSLPSIRLCALFCCLIYLLILLQLVVPPGVSGAVLPCDSIVSILYSIFLVVDFHLSSSFVYFYDDDTLR